MKLNSNTVVVAETVPRYRELTGLEKDIILFLSNKQTNITVNKLSEFCKINRSLASRILSDMEEDGIIVPVKKGETGLLVYTTIAREGTIYIRYAPGDEATLIKNESECTCGIKTEIISDIKRIDSPNDIISTGCCVG